MLSISVAAVERPQLDAPVVAARHHYPAVGRKREAVDVRVDGCSWRRPRGRTRGSRSAWAAFPPGEPCRCSRASPCRRSRRCPSRRDRRRPPVPSHQRPPVPAARARRSRPPRPPVPSRPRPRTRAARARRSRTASAREARRPASREPPLPPLPRAAVVRGADVSRPQRHRRPRRCRPRRRPSAAPSRGSRCSRPPRARSRRWEPAPSGRPGCRCRT